jgi:drug/metabolite transporter (DMT)-like permease
VTASGLDSRLLQLQVRHAVYFVLLSGVLNSFSGLILRSVEQATEWQIILYRTGAFSLTLIVAFVIRDPDAFFAGVRRMGFWGLVCAGLFCTMQTMFVFSLSNTTVANTVFILSSGPILTAFLARLVLREPVGSRTWTVLVLALLGTGIMMLEGLRSGTFLGNFAAAIGAMSFAGFVVILRARRHVDMMPSVVVGGCLATVVAFVFAGGNPGIPTKDALLCIFWGGGLSSLVLILFTLASRQLRGAELTLLLMLEYFLAPFWVWAFVQEVPSYATLAGGAIVLSAVAAQAYMSNSRDKAAIGAPSGAP